VRSSRWPVAGAALVLATALGACNATASDADRDPGGSPPPAAELEAALSEPVEDRVYPDVGDPGVDALHYDLDLTWDPDGQRLDAHETLTFRSTEDDDEFQLDLVSWLEVSDVTLDGEPVDHRQDDKDLVIEADVERDGRYVLELDYTGSPRGVAAPTTRADIPLLGWTTMADGEAWTLQEPFGAYTWYAVNDQPADKALYDFTLRVPEPMDGVANGVRGDSTVTDGQRVTRWHLAEPAASYLVTVAFGTWDTAEVTSASGVPITIYLPPEEADQLDRLAEDTVTAMDWSEDVLGPYPFDSLGFLFVDSTSGMETQTMITLGVHEYAMSLPVLVHETVHHWWGDQISPRDWRDVWMNEGMTMYLQALWESENGGPGIDARMAEWAAGGNEMRQTTGPPADYEPNAFAERNVYYLPAVMWHDIRGRLGDPEFFRLVRWWPASHDNETAGYDDIVAWWSEQSGVDLEPVFRRHLLGEQQPRTRPAA
jgi:aminopeptidase N